MDTQSKPKPHVITFPFPGQGHISPILHLSRAIAAQGYTVSLVNVDSLTAKMQETLQPGLDIRLEPIPFKWSIPNGFDFYCLQHIGEFFEDIPSMEQDFEVIVERLCKTVAPVLCIISDYFFTWTQRVADKFGIPLVIYTCGSASYLNIEFHAPELLRLGVLPITDLHFKKDELIKLPGLSPILMSEVPMYLRKEGPMDYGVLVRSPSITKSSFIFINSFKRLEPQAFDAIQEATGCEVAASGPFFLNKMFKGGTHTGKEECLCWLDTQTPSSVLYISFGSISVVPNVQLQRLAEAMEFLKQPFLWVIRHTKLEELSWYQGFEERSKSYGRVVSWAPQLKVLGHPSVGGFITHCGWNSVLESLGNAVPMICWPCASEQNLNCKFVVKDWRVGIAVRMASDGLVEKEEIERVVSILMHGSEGEEMGKRIKELARDIMDEEADALKELQTYLDKLNLINI